MMNYGEADSSNYSKSELKLLVEDAIDWAHSNGLIIRTPAHKDRFCDDYLSISVHDVNLPRLGVQIKGEIWFE